MNEQEIYDVHGSEGYRSRVQRKCAAYNCESFVSHPDDEFCAAHQPSQHDEAAAIEETLRIIDEADVEPGDRVEYDGREWTFHSYLIEHAVALVADDGTIKRNVDVRELTPAVEQE